MRGLEITAALLIGVMMLGPLALAPAYGPYVAPGTAAEVDAATTPLEDGSTEGVASVPGDASSAEVADASPAQR